MKLAPLSESFTKVMPAAAPISAPRPSLPHHHSCPTQTCLSHTLSWEMLPKKLVLGNMLLSPQCAQFSFALKLTHDAHSHSLVHCSVCIPYSPLWFHRFVY